MALEEGFEPVDLTGFEQGFEPVDLTSFEQGFEPVDLSVYDQSLAGAAFRNFIVGAADPIATMPKAMAQDEYFDSIKALRLFDEVDQTGTFPDPTTGLLPGEMPAALSGPEARAWEYSRATPEQRQTLKENLSQKVLAGIPDTWGDDLTGWFEKHVPVDPTKQDNPLVKLSGALGQISTYTAEALLLRRFGMGKASVPLGALQGSMANSYESFNDALMNGASIEDAYTAAGFGKLWGLSEVLPITKLLDRLDKKTGGVFKNSLKQFIEEGTQEAGVKLANNITANLVYDKETGLYNLKDTLEEGLIGGSAGAIAAFIGTLLAGKRSWKSRTAQEAATFDWAQAVNKAEIIPPTPWQVASIFSGQQATQPTMPWQESTAKPGKGDTSDPDHKKGQFRQFFDTLAGGTYRRSVDSIFQDLEFTPTGRKLKAMFEHQRTLEGEAGVVKPQDWYEKKLTYNSELYNPVENALERVRDTWGGRRLSRKNRELIYDYITKGTKVPHNRKAVQAALAGDFTYMEKLKGAERKRSELVHTAEVMKQTVDEIHNKMDERGIAGAYSKVNGVLPLFLNSEYIRNNQKEFNSWLRVNNYASNQVHAREITENILSNKGVPFLNEPVRHRALRSLEEGKPGVVNKPIDPKTVPDKFINRDLEKILPEFSLKVSDRLAYTDQFGAGGEKLKKMVTDMINEARAAGQTVNDRNIDAIYDLSDALLGRYNPWMQQGMQNVSKAVTAFETISTLGGATLSSIQEPFVIFERLGFGPTIRAMPQAMSVLGRGMVRAIHRRMANKADAMAVAEDVGVAAQYATQEVLSSAFSAEHSNVQDVFFKSPLGGFLYQWTRFVRAWASATALKKYNYYQRQYNSKGGFTKKTIAQLADLGIDHRDFANLLDALKTSNMTVEDLMIQHTKAPNAVTEQLMNLPGTVTPYNYLRTGVARAVNDIVMSPRATTRPMWFNDPHFSWISQLKSFPITFGNTVGRRYLTKLNPKQRGNCEAAGALAALGLGIGVATAMQYIKDLAYGRDPTEPAIIETPQEVMQSKPGMGVQQTGIFGPLQFLLDTFNFGPKGFGSPALNDAFTFISNTMDVWNDRMGTYEYLDYLGKRSAQMFGLLGKNKDFQEGVQDAMVDMFY